MAALQFLMAAGKPCRLLLYSCHEISCYIAKLFLRMMFSTGLDVSSIRGTRVGLLILHLNGLNVIFNSDLRKNYSY